jgi:hypothetical protein
MSVLKWARTQWDRVGAWFLIAAGALAIFVGWNGVSTEALTAKQVPYIVSGGIGGLFLLGVGAMLWLSADLRDEWRKLDAIERNTRVEADVAAQDEGDPFAPAPQPEIGLDPAVPVTNGAATEPVRRSRRTKPLTGR